MTPAQREETVSVIIINDETPEQFELRIISVIEAQMAANRVLREN